MNNSTTRRNFLRASGVCLDHGDEAHLKTIRTAAAKNGGGVRALLLAMVLSEPFRNK
jgi:hypothetical protein